MCSKDTERAIYQSIDDIRENFTNLKEHANNVVHACTIIAGALQSGGKVMFCGNGGSAADAQHLAAELTGRFMKDRQALAGLALTVDTSVLTAIANDYSYADVFSRQLEGLGRRGDVLVGISTSGNSENVVRALAVARQMGLRTVGLTGEVQGRMTEHCEVCIQVPATRADRVQEMHIAVGHLICQFVEDALS